MEGHASVSNQGEHPASRLLKVKNLVTVTVAGLLATVSTLLVLQEKLQALFTNKAVLYAYILLDLFRWELLAIFMGLVAFSFLRRRLASTVAALGFFYQGRAAAKAYRRQLLFVGISAIFLLWISWKQGERFVLGKKIHYTNYDEILIDRANEDFKRSRLLLARLHLRVCAEVLNRCATTVSSMDERLEKARILRKAYEQAPAYSVGKRQLLDEILALDGDQVFHDQGIADYRRSLAAIHELYLEALRAIVRKDSEDAIKNLREVQARFPGYGDCHLLLSELNGGGGGRAVEGKRVYLNALQRQGVETFARNVVGDLELRLRRSLLEIDSPGYW